MTEPELLERLEAASEGSRELDAALHVAVVKPEQYPDDLRYYRLPTPTMDHMEMCAPGTYWLKQRSGASLQTAPLYTASLDAITALIERVLPGWRKGFRDHDELEGPGCCAWICTEGFRATGDAPTMPLAACIALLRARALSQPKQGE